MFSVQEKMSAAIVGPASSLLRMKLTKALAFKIGPANFPLHPYVKLKGFME